MDMRIDSSKSSRRLPGGHDAVGHHSRRKLRLKEEEYDRENGVGEWNPPSGQFRAYRWVSGGGGGGREHEEERYRGEQASREEWFWRRNPPSCQCRANRCGPRGVESEGQPRGGAVGDQESLGEPTAGDEATRQRAVVARCIFLGRDRPDLQDAAEQASRWICEPRRHDNAKVSRHGKVLGWWHPAHGASVSIR